MQLRAEHGRAAEENTGFGGGVDLPDRLENHVPVGATKVCWCTQTGNSVLLGVGVVNHDVGCVVCLDLCGEILEYVSLCHDREWLVVPYCVDFDVVVKILRLDSQQQ